MQLTSIKLSSLFASLSATIIAWHREMEKQCVTRKKIRFKGGKETAEWGHFIKELPWSRGMAQQAGRGADFQAC